MRELAIFTVAAAVSCALASRAATNELFEHAKAQMTDAMKACDAKFPGGVQSVVNGSNALPNRGYKAHVHRYSGARASR